MTPPERGGEGEGKQLGRLGCGGSERGTPVRLSQGRQWGLGGEGEEFLTETGMF